MRAAPSPIFLPGTAGEHRRAGRVPFAMRWPPEGPLLLEMRRRICCIIPCYNVGALCAPVIRECAGHVGRIIVVDDGSTDDTPRFLRDTQAEFPDRVHVLTLAGNQGKGVALVRGFRHALRQTDCDVILTIDGDGQHRPGDIPRIARPCLKGRADFVIAQRQFPRSTPARSRVGNNLSTAILSAAYRHTPRDTQCGLRAHTRQYVRDVLEVVEGNRYETEARIIMLALRWGRRIGQVPIPAIYHGRNESSHYRPLMDSLRILGAFFTTVMLPELGVPVWWRKEGGRGDSKTRGRGEGA
ncbi:MAG: dolichol-phosphate mannose synthase [Phycisphaerales bacterium]|nr:dolichol-phosphate mannose synthase [Phycisphaerales bacterium]